MEQDARTLVAETSDGPVVGAVNYRAGNGVVALIQHVVVDSDYAGHGIARQLLDAIEDFDEISVLLAGPPEGSNQGSTLAFFERCGFTVAALPDGHALAVRPVRGVEQPAQGAVGQRTAS